MPKSTKNFFGAHIPLGIVLLLVLIFITISLYFYLYLRVIDYTINLPKGDSLTNSFVYGSWPEFQNADYFKQVKDNFIQSQADFIEADLSSMKIRVYKAGALTQEFPILSKGKEGSWWETP